MYHKSFHTNGPTRRCSDSALRSGYGFLSAASLMEKRFTPPHFSENQLIVVFSPDSAGFHAPVISLPDAFLFRSFLTNNNIQT